MKDNYFDQTRFEFWLEPTVVHAKDFDEAYSKVQKQLYMGMCPMYYKAEDKDGKVLQEKTNIRILTVDGVNAFLLKDQPEKQIHLSSKSTGEKIT